MRHLPTDLAPFRVPAFRRYLLAATITSTCLWMYTTGISWTLLGTTGSAAVVGLFATAMTLPLPFVQIPAGVLTDRLGPRGLMAAALAVEAICVGGTGVLAATGHLTVPAALAIGAVLGIADGCYIVPSQVFVGRAVDHRAMTSAIGLSMLSFGFGRIIGGPLGGGLVQAAGPAAALIPAGVGVVIAVALVLTCPRIEGTGSGGRVSRDELLAALRWVRRVPEARAVIALGVVAAITLWPYLGVLAVVVADRLGGSASELGWLTAAGGVGVIIAGISLASLGAGVPRGRLLVAAMTTAGVLVVLLGWSMSLPATLVLAMLLAVATVIHTATTNTLLQALAPVRIRGRVLALHGFLFFSAMPLGLVVAGVASDGVGVDLVLSVLGVATICGTLAVAVADRRLLSVRLVATGEDLAVPADVLFAAPVATVEPAPSGSDQPT